MNVRDLLVSGRTNLGIMWIKKKELAIKTFPTIKWHHFCTQQPSHYRKGSVRETARIRRYEPDMKPGWCGNDSASVVCPPKNNHHIGCKCKQRRNTTKTCKGKMPLVDVVIITTGNCEIKGPQYTARQLV